MKLALAWLGSPLSRRVDSQRRTQISQVPGLPLCARAAFLDPGGRCSPRHRGEQHVAFAVRKRLGIHDYRIFGVLSRGPFAHCVRFAADVTGGHATLATEPLARLCSGGIGTRWVASSNFWLCYTAHVLSFDPSFAWRTPNFHTPTRVSRYTRLPAATTRCAAPRRCPHKSYHSVFRDLRWWLSKGYDRGDPGLVGAWLPGAETTFQRLRRISRITPHAPSRARIVD